MNTMLRAGFVAALALAGVACGGAEKMGREDAGSSSSGRRPDSGVPAPDAGVVPDGGVAPDSGANPIEDAGATRNDGDPCLSDQQCRGGTCFKDPGWPGGYCVTRNCTADTQCSSGAGSPSTCISSFHLSSEVFCARACRTNDECRPGYVCTPVSATKRVCATNVASTPLPEPVDALPLGVHCGVPVTEGRATIEYTVPGDALSYMITPFARDGRYVLPVAIELPDGGRVDFASTNAFQLRALDLHGFLAPTVVPATRDLQGQLFAGPHRYVVETASEDLCYYYVDEAAAGSRIAFNIYLVGVPGLTAASAPQHADLAAVLSRVDGILGQIGVRVGDVRYLDVGAEEQERFSIIRGIDELPELARRAAQPAGLDASLSVDVFLVKGFAGGVMLDGLSLGLPGPAGLHGTRASAIVVSGELMGQQLTDPIGGGPLSGNAYTGLVWAHELGHFLGLLHTSEGDRRTFDPVADTAQCTSVSFPSGCPDATNVMFPYSNTADVLTAGQGAMVLANPLTK